MAALKGCLPVKGRCMMPWCGACGRVEGTWFRYWLEVAGESLPSAPALLRWHVLGPPIPVMRRKIAVMRFLDLKMFWRRPLV